MAVIFRREIRYEESASGSLLEREYEDMVAANAPILFPGLVLVPFKISVESEYGIRKPDFALIDRNYRKWWVVEVELAHHPFHGHVLPQVQVLATASYGDLQSQYLAAQNPTLDPQRLSSMMLGAQPQVLVVVNEACPRWEPDLRALDVLLLTVSLFRSDLNDYVLLVGGEQPEVSSNILTKCRRSQLIPRLWQVDAPGALPLTVGETADFVYRGRSMTWRRLDTGDTVFLAPEGASDALGVEATLMELVVIDGGRIEFRPPT